MYYIKRFLKLTFLLICFVLIITSIVVGYVWLQSAERAPGNGEETTRSNVHWLNVNTPLHFIVSSSQIDMIRVLSNGVFEPLISIDKPVKYAVEYTLYDEQKRILNSGLYHHSAKISEAKSDNEIKQIIENNQSLSIASGQVFYLSISQYPNVYSIGLKLIHEEPELEGVVVNVNEKIQSTNIDTINAWLKFPLNRRERATNYLTMGANALTQYEIDNAVAFSWKKIAPQGIPNVDFKSDILYQTLPYNVLNYDFEAQQFDLSSYYSDKLLCASITIDYQDILYFTTNNEQLKPLLVWYDALLYKKPQKVNYTLIDTNNDIKKYSTGVLEPGLITICSEQPLLTKWNKASGQPILTGQGTVYKIDQKNYAEYQIDSNTHLNIELRSSYKNSADIIIYDKDDVIVDSYSVTLLGSISKFDRIISETTERQGVATANNFYLRTSEKARKVVIRSKVEAMVSIKSRKQNFHYQRIIEHSKTMIPSSFQEIPAWHGQQAENHYLLQKQKRIVNIRTFAEPPKVEVKDSFYIARNLFSQLPVSNAVLVNTPVHYYQPVMPVTVFNYSEISNQKLSFALASVNKEQKTSLMYMSNTHGLKEVDPKTLTKQQLDDVTKNSTAIYQNWQGPRPWKKQRLFKLGRNVPLKLTYTSDQPDSIVIKVYRRDNNDPVVVSLEQESQFRNALVPEYSLTKKRMQLKSTHLVSAWMIHPKNSELFSYPSISQVIGSDIQKLNNIIITSEQTIWLAVLEEYSSPEEKIRWWANEKY